MKKWYRNCATFFLCPFFNYVFFHIYVVFFSIIPYFAYNIRIIRFMDKKIFCLG